ncbi:MAG: Mut7-C RNAse domain-containing protein [Candidatus Krumholzibacteriia bacterium]
MLAISFCLQGDLASLTGAPGLRHHVVGLPGPTSVKDALENLGIPHTEVDLLLIGGLPVGFGHRVRDADRFDVHPVPRADLASTALLPWPEARLQPRPLARERFVCDQHLGRLARLLRLLGFDTLYGNDWGETEIARLATRDNRAVLTCSRALLKRRAVETGRLVRARAVDAQACEVIERFGLAGRERPFTRCNLCNGELRAVAKAAVAVRVPLRTRSWCDNYFLCSGCDHLYWAGTHVVKIRARIAELLSENDPGAT